jgi:superfamily II DNA or RNA helicase
MLARIDDNHFIHLEQVTVSIEQILDRWFRAREPSARYSNIEHWDGWYRRYNSKRQRLALPFLDELKNCCKISKIPLEIVDNRSDPKYPAPSKGEIGKDYLDGVVLEDYQVRALHACCDKEIGLVSLTTGAGKTEVLCGLVKMFKCPSMIIVDQIIILEQIVKRLSLRGVVKQEDVGMFCYGHLPDSDNLVMVGSIQSLSTPSKITRDSVSISKTKAIEMYRQWVKTDHTQLEHVPNVIKNIGNIRDIDGPLLKLLISHCEDVEWNRLQNWYKTRRKKAAVIQKLVGKCELLLCDECDTCVTQQHAKLFKSHYSGRRKYGVTGTPYDKDKPVRNLFLKEHLGNVICEASREEVQAAGRIIPIKHYSIVVGADGNRNDCRVYDIAMREEMIENEKFHNTVCKVVSAYKDERTLILLGTSPIEPLGRTLEGMITDSKFVFGKTPKKDRRKYIELFEKGELKCLIGSLVFKRGLDLSGGVDNLIIIGGGAKYSEYNQRIGRAIRLNEKGHARVFGFFFLNNKHLYKHSRANLKAVVEMGYPTWVIYGGKTIDGEKFINSRYRLPRL